MRYDRTDFEQVENWLEYHDFEYEEERSNNGRQSSILAKIPAKVLKNFNDEDQVIDLMIQFNFICEGDRNDQDEFETEDTIERIAIIGLTDFRCDSVVLSEDCISMRNGRESAHEIYIYS